ncbi:hypothetical protein SD70_02360 [Gordoniibacillus kamchatkensis]|uniref:Uncharacterized protein n=1 Tax=Gordoniibacillus kamchatkensis TaxID=1590651 RepID=A0ABR5AM05_9BACL|nr:hypothetical protein SD70_02360 [Paenibacillus sp. VKM B-2647]
MKQFCMLPSCTKPDVLLPMKEWAEVMLSEDAEFNRIPFEDRWHMYQEYKKRMRTTQKAGKPPNSLKDDRS